MAPQNLSCHIAQRSARTADIRGTRSHHDAAIFKQAHSATRLTTNIKPKTGCNPAALNFAEWSTVVLMLLCRFHCLYITHDTQGGAVGSLRALLGGVFETHLHRIDIQFLR